MYQNYIEFKVIGSGNYMLGIVLGSISNACYAGQFSNGYFPLVSRLVLA